MSRVPIAPIKIPMAGKATRAVNEIGRQVSDLSSIDATGGVNANRGPTGLSLINTAPILRKAQWYGVIVNAGPDSAANFTDARYWVQEVIFVQSELAKPTDTATYAFRPNGHWVVGINLADLPVGSHSLASIAPSADWSASTTGGVLVMVTLIHGGKITTVDGDHANRIYIIEAVANGGLESATPVRVKITGAAAGGGKYTGSVLTPVLSDVSASGDLTSDEFGATPVFDNALILNMNEVGQSTHIMTDASNGHEFYFNGELIRVNADGTKVVAINGFFGGC